MIFKRGISIIAMALFSLALFSQVEESVTPGGNQKKKEKPPLTNRLIFGGEIGLSFGTITYIKLAPLVGYRDYHLETSTYGAKVVVSFTVLKASDLPKGLSLGDIAVHVENEFLNVAVYDPYYTQFTDRVWIDNLLVGAGIVQSLGGRFGISVFILWDVTQNIYSPYSNPILKFGFSF
jgi:hypothetical protein